MRMAFALLTWILPFGYSGLCWGQDDPLEYVRILESAERVRKLQIERVVEVLSVQPGDKIADLGAGSGLFTRPLARKVGPEGVVYAVDINKTLLEHIQETAFEDDLENITTVLASHYDPKIPEKVDLVLICDTLHQIENPGVYLQNLGNYISDGGRVAIIDYERAWPKRLEELKYTPLDLDAWMTTAGYQLQTKYGFLMDNFFVIYRYTSRSNQLTD